MPSLSRYRRKTETQRGGIAHWEIQIIPFAFRKYEILPPPGKRSQAGIEYDDKYGIT